MSTNRTFLPLRRRLFFIGFAIISQSFFGANLAAQTSQEPAKEQAAAPYTLADLHDATEKSNKLFSDVRAIYTDTLEVLELESALKNHLATNKYRVGNDSMFVDFNDIDKSISVDEIMFWQTYQAQLAELHEKITRRFDAGAAYLNQVQEVNNQWAATVASADSTVSEASRESLLSNANTAKQTTLELNAYLDKLFSIEQMASRELAFVESYQTKLEELRLEMARTIFVSGHKPLLQLVKEAEFKPAAAFKKGFSSNYTEFKNFFSTSYWRVLLHVGLAVFLFFFLQLLKRGYRVNDVVNAEKVGPAKLIFDFPLTSALTLALIASGWFYTAIPLLYVNVLFVLSIIPIGLLFPRIINRSIKFLWVFLVLVVFFDKLAQLLSADETSHRLILLIGNLIAVVGFGMALFTRRSNKTEKRRPGWRVAIASMYVYVLALLVGIIANFKGAYLLSVILNHGVIHSFTVGVLAYLGVVIVLRLVLVITRFSLVGNLLLLDKYSREFERWLFFIITGIGLFIWIRASLRGFEVIDFVVFTYEQAVTHTWQFGEISMSLQNVIDFGYILLIFILIANALHLVLREEVLPRVDARRGFPLAATVLSRYLIMLLGFVLAMSAAGIELSKLNLLISALGVGIGFGLQSVVSNFVSGLVIIFERPINIGDTVTAGNVEGKVTGIGLRSSHIRTYDGAEIIVPNNNLVVNDVTNWTYSDKKRRIERIVFVDAGPNPRHVKQVMDSVITGHPGLVDDPTGQAYFLGYENQALKYRVLMWMNDNILSNPSEVLLNLHDALTANGYKPSMPVMRVLLETDANNDESRIVGESTDVNPIK